MADSIFAGALENWWCILLSYQFGADVPMGQGRRLGSALNFGDACGRVINLPQLPERAWEEEMGPGPKAQLGPDAEKGPPPQ